MSYYLDRNDLALRNLCQTLRACQVAHEFTKAEGRKNYPQAVRTGRVEQRKGSHRPTSVGLYRDTFPE